MCGEEVATEKDVFKKNVIIALKTVATDIVEGVLRVMNKAPEKVTGEDGLPIPPYAVYNIGNNQPGDVPVTYADTSALERDFGFKPSTSLRDGLRKFAEWYKEFYL